MSWKAEVFTEGKWYSNAIRVATQEEAEAYGRDLLNRWLVPTDMRTVESDDPVTHRLVREGEGDGTAHFHWVMSSVDVEPVLPVTVIDEHGVAPGVIGVDEKGRDVVQVDPRYTGADEPDKLGMAVGGPDFEVVGEIVVAPDEHLEADYEDRHGDPDGA
jgi:hypothetical protein